MKIEKIREFLHEIPELGFEEFKTSDFIKKYTKDYKCKVYTFNKTGIVLSFNDHKKKTICFRAEEDALPIEEKNNVSYKSKFLNRMHACGHDGHMAIILKLSDYINSNLNKIKYNVLLIFQPSEEIYGGSKSLIESNILNKKKIIAFYALHIWPRLEKGRIVTSYNPMLSKAIEFNICIHDENRHIGDIKENRIFNVLTLLLNEIDKLDKSVKEKHRLGIGKINGGSQRNITPSSITLYGSIRVFEESVSKRIINDLKNIIVDISLNENIYITMDINDNFYVVKNDKNLLDKIKNEVSIEDVSFYQSEDFGLYTSLYPCVFFLLGGGNISSLHSDTFNFDMNILNIGLDLFKKLVLKKY